MTTTEIIKLAKALRKIGVAEFKLGDLKLKFGPTEDAVLADSLDTPLHASQTIPLDSAAGNDYQHDGALPQPPSPEELEQAFYDLSLRGI